MILTNLGCVTLEEADKGHYQVQKIETEINYIIRKLMTMGIYEDSYLKVMWHRKGVGVIVEINRGKYTIGFGVARMLILKDVDLG